jgi:hypothetical protein
VTLFVCYFCLPTRRDRAVLLEWLRQEHIAELHRMSKPYKPLALEGDDECVLCLDQFEVGQQVLQLPCGHKFHTSCIQQVRVRRRTTPVAPPS